MSEARPPRKATRGRLVEFVRFIFITLFALAGYEVGAKLWSPHDEPWRTVVGIVVGALLGYVVGGIFGRQTAHAVDAVEKEFRRAPAAEVAAGVVGLIVGLVIALLLSIPLFRLPSGAAWPLVAFLYLTLPYLGYRVGRGKHAEMFSLVGLKPRAAGLGRAEVNVVDTSAFIDGRILDLVQTGFLGGVLLVPRGVLGELQRIADSSDGNRRARGRRGLDILAQLQRDPMVEVILVDEEAMGDVDAGLVRLARDRGGAVVTADSNLVKVAQALQVPVRSIHALAAAFRVPFLPGESLHVRLTRPGRDHGQAVGYLEDGTMVVVEDAADRIGVEADVTVTNVLQTTTGRMVFAALAESDIGVAVARKAGSAADPPSLEPSAPEQRTEDDQHPEARSGETADSEPRGRAAGSSRRP
ncbi:MAG TPA: TRAM domain-containing protein [Actinomycetota bacterium]|nr:TRAM domain-containing protein [Actinomycetota bacterium]